MAQREEEPVEQIEFCPPPAIVTEFCLEELYPQFMFRYMRQRRREQEDLQLCQLVHTNSQTDFAYLSDVDRRVADQISSDLNTAYGGGTASDREQESGYDFTVTDQFLHPGMPVAARYLCTDDLRWYRAVIVSIDRTPGKAKPIQIRFVDYGNSQSNEPNQLKMMPIDLGNCQPLAIKGRLRGLDAKEDIPEEARKHFNTWSTSLRDYKVLISNCGYDAVENEVIVRLFNAQDGGEYQFPMEMRKPQTPIAPPVDAPPPPPADTPFVADLIALDEEENMRGAEQPEHQQPQQQQVLQPVKLTNGYENGGGATVTDGKTGRKNPNANGGSAGDGESPIMMANEGELGDDDSDGSTDEGYDDRVEMVDHGTQIDEAEFHRDEASTSAAVADNSGSVENGGGDGEPTEEYHPFVDPKYSEFIAKYPALMSYMRLKMN